MGACGWLRLALALAVLFAVASSADARNDSPLRVVCLGDEWLSRTGGVSTVNRMLVEGLPWHSARAVHVTCVLPDVPLVRGDVEKAQEENALLADEARVAFHWVPHTSHDERNASDTRGFLTTLLSTTITLAHTPHVVVGHGLVNGAAAARLAYVWGCHRVHFVHTVPRENERAKEERAGEMAALRRAEIKLQSELELVGARENRWHAAAAVFGLGDKLRKAWVNDVGSLEVAFHTVTPWLPHVPEHHVGHVGEGAFTFLTVGRMAAFKQKGVLDAARAIAELLPDWGGGKENVKYVLRGFDTQADLGAMWRDDSAWRVREMAPHLLQPEVLSSTLGVIPRTLFGASVVLMPSRGEAFGLVALEALAAGKVLLVGSDSGFATQLRELFDELESGGGGAALLAAVRALWGEEATLHTLRDAMIVDNTSTEIDERVAAWKAALRGIVGGGRTFVEKWARVAVQLRAAYDDVFSAETCVRGVEDVLRDVAVRERSEKHVPKWHPVAVGVPAPRVFEGRSGELDELLARLAPTTTGDVTRTAIVHTGTTGLGGIGKTALAIEAVHRVLDERHFPLAVWCNADTPAALEASLAAAAEALGVARVVGEDDAATAQRVRARLEERDEPWLLVLDNVDAAPEDIKQRVPAHGRGSVLVTSRRHDLSDLHADIHMLRLDALPADEAVALAARLSGNLAREHADGDAAEAAARRRVAVDVLGGLPLAIEQAAAFVRRGESSFAVWAERFARERTSLFGHKRAAPLSTRETVHTTWRTSMAQLREEDDATAAACERVMRVLAVCAPDAIPHAVVAAAMETHSFVERIARWLMSFIWDPQSVTLDDVLAALGAHSLVQRGAQSVSVHRLVQAVVRDSVGDAAAVEALRVRVAALLFRVWPAVEEMRTQPAARAAGRALLPHGQHVLETCGAEVVEVLNVAVRCANTLQLSGSSAEAARVGRRVIDLLAAVRGDAEHPDVLHAKMLLGQELREAGQYEEAQAVLEEMLEAMRRVMGEEDVRTLECMRHLVFTLYQCGSLARAEELGRAALETARRMAGEEGEITLAIVQSLALVLKDGGKLEEAEEMERVVLKGMESLHGADHPHTLTTLNNLANTLLRRGQPSEAEDMHRRVVEASVRVLGDEHPETSDARFNLAGPLIGLRKFDEARAILQRLLQLPPEQRSAQLTEQRIQERLMALSVVEEMVSETNTHEEDVPESSVLHEIVAFFSNMFTFTPTQKEL